MRPPPPLLSPDDAGHGANDANSARGEWGQSRILQVEHLTEIVYSCAVEEAHHVACLRPLHDPRQQLLSHSLEVSPSPQRCVELEDAFGNTRLFFSGLAPHDCLQVKALSRVKVAAAPLGPVADSPAWESLVERLSYRAGAAFEPAVEFAQASARVPRLQALRDWALQEFTPRRPLMEAVCALMGRMHREFEFDPTATQVCTPMELAFEQGRGVCQDFSHIFIGALRALGLSARYVSGYLLTQAPQGSPRLQGADASHAWVAVWCPGTAAAPRLGEWVELDPTNNCLPGLGHVRLAHGRDYDDVSPLRGVIRGGGQHRLDVRVTTLEWQADATNAPAVPPPPTAHVANLE
jgi:transglutaminase-like putative cysteine protease